MKCDVSGSATPESDSASKRSSTNVNGNGGNKTYGNNDNNTRSAGRSDVSGTTGSGTVSPAPQMQKQRSQEFANAVRAYMTAEPGSELVLTSQVRNQCCCFSRYIG